MKNFLSILSSRAEVAGVEFGRWLGATPEEGRAHLLVSSVALATALGVCLVIAVALQIPA
jgi:mRNA-degrading endonuclease toxin of MazEF toxin-antitoxin module